MKKLTVIFIAFVFLISCKDMKRVNPTDPQASNYIGMHYTGSISGISEVTDFDAYGGNVYAVDKTKALLYCFDKSGDEKWETEPDVFEAPVSVYLNGSFIYVLDASGAPNGNTLTVITTAGALADFAVGLTENARKIIVDDSYIYIAGINEVIKYNKTITLNALTYAGITAGSAGTGDGQFMRISDMCFNGAGEIVVADSELDRISFMDLNGIFRMKIEPGTDIKGVEVKDGILYVPCAAGIIEYSCVNGSKLRVWADYGEGNGKVIKPALIDTMDSAVYVENVSDIKVFEP